MCEFQEHNEKPQTLDDYVGDKDDGLSRLRQSEMMNPFDLQKSKLGASFAGAGSIDSLSSNKQSSPSPLKQNFSRRKPSRARFHIAAESDRVSEAVAA